MSAQQGTPVYDSQGVRVWELAYDPKTLCPEGSLHMVRTDLAVFRQFACFLKSLLPEQSKLRHLDEG